MDKRPSGWGRLQVSVLCGLALMVLTAQLQVSLATGIDFDLNEPPPADPDDHQVAQTIRKFNESPALAAPAPPSFRHFQPLSAPGRFNRPGSHRKCASESQCGLSGWAKRVVSKLPDYFDFGSFKGKFKRAYQAADSQLRQSLYVKKCVEVFKSRVRYRKGNSTYLKAINKFSDKTPEEFSKIYMVAPPIENYQSGGLEQQQHHQQHHQQQQQQQGNQSSIDLDDYLKNVKDRKRQLERERRIAGSIEQVSQSSLEQIGRSPDGANQFNNLLLDMAQQEINQLLSQSLYEDEQLTSAIYDELNEVAIERISQSANQQDGAASQHQLPWPGQAKSTGAAGHHNNDNDQLMVERQLDWSQHECFHSIYDQGTECGKCYVLATASLAEFYKCTELGPGRPVKKRQFSKDYVLNCAPKYSATIMGCAGGSMLNTLRFMALAGVFNIRGWQQLKKQRPTTTTTAIAHVDDLKCPLDPYQTPYEKWGPIKVKLNPQVVPRGQDGHRAAWLEALQDGPLVVSVQMPAEGVDSYAEGIHDGAGCATSGHWHAMILVGYGHDHAGRPYWRFRNSFGPDWGMQGHFHLSAELPEACFGAAVRVYREPLSVPDDEAPKRESKLS